jgi:hypothetical protein
VIDFFILYPIVWFFERKRDGVDPWNIAIAVGIPAVVTVMVFFGMAYVDKAELGQLINMFLFPLIVGICLWQIVGLPGKRAAVYSFLYLSAALFIGPTLIFLGVIDAS